MWPIRDWESHFKMTSVSEERKCFWAGDRNIIYITRTMQILWSLCLY